MVIALTGLGTSVPSLRHFFFFGFRRILFRTLRGSLDCVWIIEEASGHREKEATQLTSVLGSESVHEDRSNWNHKALFSFGVFRTDKGWSLNSIRKEGNQDYCSLALSKIFYDKELAVYTQYLNLLTEISENLASHVSGCYMI